MADGVVLRGIEVPENYKIFTENGTVNPIKASEMVQEAMEASFHFEAEDSSCFSKCSIDESSTSPTSNNFSSDFCDEKEDEIHSLENEDNFRKKRCSDRYDSAESSDSGIAVSSGASTSSGNSDLTDPGSPFSTSSDDSSPSKSSSCRASDDSPLMAPSVEDCSTNLSTEAVCPVASRQPAFPSRRTVRTGRPAEARCKRRVVRRQHVSDTQGKITEYFKSQSKPLVGIKRDFNYLKKELFTDDPTITIPAKKPREPLVIEKKDAIQLPKLPLAFLRQRPPPAKTLFNKILHNHKQRKFVEAFLRPKIDKAAIGEVGQLKTEELSIDCGVGRNTSHAPKSPILTAPKTIRFPVDRQTTFSKQYHCRWLHCSKVFQASVPLLDHLQNSHVATQDNGDTFVCLWNGCKVFNRKSCSRLWLERHTSTHVGNKPYRCIVDNCGQAFSTQSLLQRHVNHHFVTDAKRGLELTNGQKLFRRNFKRIKVRRQPPSARTDDYFDNGMFLYLDKRFIRVTQARAGGSLDDTPDHHLSLTCDVMASRVLDSGQKQFLVSWSPPDVIDDEWVNACDLRRRRAVPFHEVPSATLAQLSIDWGLVRKSRRSRRRKQIPTPPQSPEPVPMPTPILIDPVSRTPTPSPSPQANVEPDASATSSPPPSADSSAASEVVNSSEPIRSSSPKRTQMSIHIEKKIPKKQKRKRSTGKLKSPIDPDALPRLKIPVVDIVKTRQIEPAPSPQQNYSALTTVTATTTSSPSTSYILNSQQFKLVSQPFLNTVMPMPVTYQLQPQIQPQMQQPLYFLPQAPAPMFQTIHFSSNIVQQQSILTSLNLHKSPTLLLVNTTKQVNVSLTQERPKQKVDILPKPECLLPIQPS